MPRKSSKETLVVLSGVVYTNDEHTGIGVGSAAWWNWLTDQKRFYLDNVTPADVFFGRQEEVLTQREMIKQQTLLERRKINLCAEVHSV